MRCSHCGRENGERSGEVPDWLQEMIARLGKNYSYIMVGHHYSQAEFDLLQINYVSRQLQKSNRWATYHQIGVALGIYRS